jgi:predicted ferric reductase
MAMTRKYRARVASIEQPIEETFVVVLESLGRDFKFKPGQFLHLALDTYDAAQAWPDSRCFSIQSSPEEKMVKLTFSVKGKYTRRMSNELEPGKEVFLKLPYGDLFQKTHKKEHCVFIAGGTGITPYLSLFNDRSFSEYKGAKIYFGVRNLDFHIYRCEFEQALNINPSLKIQITNQATEGILNIKNIIKANKKDSTYFISGPPEMIKTFENTLYSMGIENVQTDNWE